MFRAVVTLALALPLVANSATDPVIYDNGGSDPRLIGGIVMSNDRLPADDFIVGSSTIGAPEYLLIDAHFLASQVGSGTGTWDGRIRWFLFSDDPLSPTPGELIAAGEGANIQRDFVRILSGVVQEFAYSFDFDAPLSLEADTVYWLALNMGPTNFDIIWRTADFCCGVQGNTSVLGSVSSLPDPGPQDWNTGPRSDKAFFLTGVPVPESIAVEIDIKPGSELNPIHPISRGRVPVAILGSDAVDVLDVDPDSLAFGPDGAGLAHPGVAHFEDVDDDGFTDLVAHFAVRETGIGIGDEEACITGEIHGMPFEGCDAIRTVGGCGLGYELAFLLPPLMELRRRRGRRTPEPAPASPRAPPGTPPR